MPSTQGFRWAPNLASDNVTGYLLRRGPSSLNYTATIDLGAGTSAPNPEGLPQATTAQAPLATAYGALGVPSLAAGATYVDPVTGVTITKLTSAAFPSFSPAAGWGHDYSEGGHEISLPHTGTTRTVKLFDASTLTHWLIDFTPGTGVS